MNQQDEIGGVEPPRRVSALHPTPVVEPVVVVEEVSQPVVLHQEAVVLEPVVVHEVEKVGLFPEPREKKPLAEEAKGLWRRAKAGFEKGKGEAEGQSSTIHPTDSDGVLFEPVVLVEEEEVEAPSGIWERIVEIVPGVAAFHGTGRAATHHEGRAGATDGFWNEDAFDPRKPKPLPDVIKDATEEASGLIHAEMALARTEIKSRMKVILPALLLFVVAITVLLYAVGVLIWTIILGLAHLVPLWLSALIVGVLMLLVVAGLIYAGIRMLKKLSGKRWLTSETIKDDITAITSAFKTKNWENAQQKIKEERL